MPTIWALSDLHLSTSGSKPMDVFGEHWGDHAGKMAAAWDAAVADDDIVLTPGDFSWAMKAEEAAGDFAWLGQRPGHKILVKGNHDYWWPPTRTKMAALLPPKTHALKKTACVIHGVGFFGVRGGDFAPLTRYGDKRTPADIETWLEREAAELQTSIVELDKIHPRGGRRFCLFHYPPIAPGRTASRFTPIIQAAGASHCIYGHLHGKPEAAKVEGLFDGVEYRCMSCDIVGFTPVRILDL